VVQIPTNRLGVVEPGLANDVLAGVGLELLDSGLGRGRDAEGLALLVDARRLLDQLLGVELLKSVDAANRPVGLEINPRIKLLDALLVVQERHSTAPEGESACERADIRNVLAELGNEQR
jgi:hypothetical protein